jgi:multiple sugar transport system substrate-binding protein
MFKKFTSYAILLLLIAASALSGCDSGDGKESTSSDPSSDAAVSTEPVTVKVWINAVLSDQEFKELWQDPVKMKYPNITLEMVRQDKDHTLPAMIAAKDVPDLLYTNTNTIIQRILDPGLATDLNPYFKKFNYDLNRLDPTIVQSLKSYGTNGEIYSLPFTLVNAALWYNKDLFDKFAVSYPKDGMFWEDAYQLATKLSRQDGGKTFYGLVPFNRIWHLASPLTIPVTDSSGTNFS